MTNEISSEPHTPDDLVEEICPCEAVAMLVQYAQELASERKIRRRELKDALARCLVAVSECLDHHGISDA